MTSIPTSVRDGPYSSNALASKWFLMIYFINIWISILLGVTHMLFYWEITHQNALIRIILLPVQIIVCYFLLLTASLLLSKLGLVLVDLVHKPKEGIFKRDKSDKDFYFWSLRAVIKKWPLWLSGIFPSSVLTNIILRLFGVKTSLRNNVNNANIETEFVELGKNIVVGKGSFIKSCMIFDKFLIIKKVIIEDGVILGPYSFVSPGTVIQENTALNSLAVTKMNSVLKSDSIYFGYFASEFQDLPEEDALEEFYIQMFEQTTNFSSKDTTYQDEKSTETKFIVNSASYISIFIIIYFFSYSIPLFGLYLYFTNLFYPYVVLVNPLLSNILPFTYFLVIFLTPLIFLLFHFLNILIVVLITKLYYEILCRISEPEEGTYHWSNKTKQYIHYFTRSFILRYVKWKVQRSPYPWLITPVFNFIGNCIISPGAIIEDLHLAKEFIEIGENAYLGKILLANQLWDAQLTVKGVKIDKNVVISDGCCIAPGTSIKNNTTILPFSITSKDDMLSPNSYYFGAPIQKITKKELFQLFDLQLDV
ncbi:MAG: membrane protein of unknown function [Promethearchaeota archaeon]|nr:MAG: membrane protein of unknown function [Candidatus Lokiarchaeota archaeon]